MTLQELRGYWRVMSLRRVFNALLVLGSYYLSRISGKNLHAGMPIALSFEPTTSCNLRCPHCPSGLRSFTRDTGMLHTDLFKSVVEQVAPYSGYLTLYFQGEPYLNRKFLDFVRLASQHRMYTVTSTNAHYLSKEVCEETVRSGLSKMIISIDGSTQESYAHYRIGGQLDKVLEGTRNIIDTRKKLGADVPFVEWQFVVFKHNENELDDIRALANEYEVDHLSVKTAQIYDFSQAEHWLPENEKLRRYTWNKGGLKIKSKLLNHCWKMWHSCVITWDGKVVPCCFDKDSKYTMGDSSLISFKEIWKGPEYDSFRKRLLVSRGEIDICRNCTEGTEIFA